MDLSKPVAGLKGVGEQIAGKLRGLGLNTIGDLITYYPRRYDDYSLVTAISKLRPGPVTIRAKIKQIKGRYARGGLHITEAAASDESGSVRIIWFNQPYRAASTKTNEEYFISGRFEFGRGRLSITNPNMELVSDFPVNAARIVPIYRETKGLKSAQIRRILKNALEQIRALPETLPPWLLKKYKLESRSQAVKALHFPSTQKELDEAKKRLGFEEVFELSLAALLNKEQQKSEHSLRVPFKLKLAKQFVTELPFKLTNAQRKVVWQIYQDMQKDQPMNRLAQGDVGSGKTVVAAMAALMVISQKLQVAFMAPTELLARQHAETIYKLLEPLGYSDQVSLLIGSLKPAAKKGLHKRIKEGKTRFIVGTHALIAEKVDMHKLGLIIVDEQHRFGVEQRKKLQAKAGHMPHILTMSATPIPRSLALTLYGELDVSAIDEVPEGRLPIKTKIISPNSRTEVYKQIDSELSKGRQMFVVCPLITDSVLTKVFSVESVYAQLKSGHFKHRRIGLLHGRMAAEQKDKIMQKFVKGEVDILVATTVIEVGVDVPNATIMLVENAERFGLAQIHQLRGRVGRGRYQGHCYLMLSDLQQPSKRLRALESTNDGFELAELDLSLRGPGAIYGTLQHGQLDLRVAKLTDVRLIVEARQGAREFIDKGEDLLKYKQLQQRVKKLRSITTLN